MYNSNNDINGAEDQKNHLIRKEYDFLFEDNLSVILILDPDDGRIIDANKSAVEFYMYPKEKLLSMTIFQINILPVVEVKNKLSIVKEKAKLSFMANHKLANGSIRIVRIQGNRIFIKNKIYLFALIYDATDLIELENEHTIVNKQLKDSLIFNQNLIENASEGIIVYDKELRYTVWNNFMAKSTGLQASNVIGRHTSDIFNQDTYHIVTDGLKRALKGEVVRLDSIEFVNPVTKLSGFTREVFSPNYDSEGNVIGVVCIISDITKDVLYQKSLAKKNRELEELNKILSKNMLELEKAKEKAEESDRLKSSFLAHVSHEIRTPLNAIVGFSTLLKDVKNPALIAKYSKIIQTNNLFLLNNIDDILAYSLIETNTFPLNLVNVDIISFLQEIYKNFNQIVDENIEFKFITHDLNNIVIYTDDNKLNQIISNLLTNAFKFTNAGVIELGIQSNDPERIILYVKDSGIGIAEENHKIIFSRFNKLNSLKPGSGLGLSICKALCEQINGKIRVDSKLGKGSTFYIDLPNRYINQGDDYDK